MTRIREKRNETKSSLPETWARKEEASQEKEGASVESGAPEGRKEERKQDLNVREKRPKRPEAPRGPFNTGRGKSY